MNVGLSTIIRLFGVKIEALLVAVDVELRVLLLKNVRGGIA